MLGLFPDAEAAQAAGAEVGATLGQLDDGYEAFFGEQRVLAADGSELARETLALATATHLDVDAVVTLVHDHGGLAVAAHVDRRSFGVIGQLGFFPADAGFDAVELSRHVAPGSAGRGRVRRPRPAARALVRRPLPERHRRGAHDRARRAPHLRRAGPRPRRRRRQERRRCVTSRCTCST